MRQIKIICMLLTVLAVMSSCLKSDDNTVTLYDDAAITAFSLGTMNRYLHTTSSTGTDSIYKNTYAGSDYLFHIDQITHRVYNTDSLPVGTDVAHVICGVATRNSGLVIIQDMDTDTLRYFSSSDSIDFTQPRKFIIYSTDGSGSTEYTISVNVHKEEADEFVWQRMEDNMQPPAPKIYDLPMEGIKQILGRSTNETYALSEDNKLMVWREESTAWEEDALDEDDALLPTQDLSMTCYPLEFAGNTDYVVLVGNRSTENYPEDSIAMVWRKIVDNDEYAPEGRWVYMERSDNNLMALPRLQNLSIVKYDDSILAIGGAGIGASTKSAYNQIYQSRDNGITWKYNALYQLPEDFDYNATSVTMYVDEQQYLWLFCAGTGQTWRGRLNRLGWEFQ